MVAAARDERCTRIRSVPARPTDLQRAGSYRFPIPDSLFPALRMPATTVMFATYNEPQWLEWVLWGYTTQTSKDFEVLVVDDGSREDTRAVIDRLRPQMNYRLRHFWQ